VVVSGSVDDATKSPVPDALKTDEPLVDKVVIPEQYLAVLRICQKDAASLQAEDA
jgi:hypothetical protein